MTYEVMNNTSSTQFILTYPFQEGKVIFLKCHGIVNWQLLYLYIGKYGGGQIFV